METQDYIEKFDRLIYDLSMNEDLLAIFTGDDLVPIAKELSERGITMRDLRNIRADREMVAKLEATEELKALDGFWFS